MALDGIIIKRMPKLQLSGLDIVHDIIPIGILSLHLSQQCVQSVCAIRIENSGSRLYRVTVLDVTSL